MSFCQGPYKRLQEHECNVFYGTWKKQSTLLGPFECRNLFWPNNNLSSYENLLSKSGVCFFNLTTWRIKAKSFSCINSVMVDSVQSTIEVSRRIRWQFFDFQMKGDLIVAFARAKARRPTYKSISKILVKRPFKNTITRLLDKSHEIILRGHNMLLSVSWTQAIF